MSDAPNVDADALEVLLELAQLQAKLKPLLVRVDNITRKRSTLINRARELGLGAKEIHRLTGVPLSTIYSNSRYPIDRKEDGEGEGTRRVGRKKEE